jgi:tetratricopeptide (TPR) repeat protein
VPAAARLHYGLGLALSWWGWPRGAAQAFNDALRIAPDLPEAQFHLGECLARQERWKEAAHAFAAAVRLQPTSTEAQANLVIALCKQEAWLRAAAALERLAVLRPRQAELHLLRGALLQRAGQQVQAIKAFRWAVRLERLPRGTRSFLGEAVLGAAEWTALVERCAGARGVPFDPEPNSQPRALQRTPLHKAPEPLREPGPRNPRKEGPLHRLRSRLRGTSVLLLALGSSAAAAESPAARSDDALRCISTRGPAAVDVCRRALLQSLAPIRSAQVEASLSARLITAGDLAGAVAVHRAAVLRRPEDAVAWTRLGETLFMSAEVPPEAEAALLEAARLAPTDSRPLVALGLVRNALGRHAEALEAFASAEKIDPEALTRRPAARLAQQASGEGRRWPPPSTSISPSSALPSFPLTGESRRDTFRASRVPIGS